MKRTTRALALFWLTILGLAALALVAMTDDVRGETYGTDKIKITYIEDVPNHIIDSDERIVIQVDLPSEIDVNDRWYAVCLYPLDIPLEPINATPHLHYFGDKENDTEILAWSKKQPAALYDGRDDTIRPITIRTTFNANLDRERNLDPALWAAVPVYCATADYRGIITYEILDYTLQNMPRPPRYIDRDKLTFIYLPIAQGANEPTIHHAAQRNAVEKILAELLRKAQ